ncbi:MAG: hypothetical protein WDW36_007116 [Sanguina aurantia]
MQAQPSFPSPLHTPPQRPVTATAAGVKAPQTPVRSSQPPAKRSASPKPRSSAPKKTPSELGCEHFASCSGCSLETRLASPPLLTDARIFSSTRGVPALQSVLHRATGWRCRAKLAVRGSPGKPLLGLFKRGSHDVVAIPKCKTHHPRINEAVALMTQVLTQLKVAPYDEVAGTGLLRYVQLTAVSSQPKLTGAEEDLQAQPAHASRSARSDSPGRCSLAGEAPALGASVSAPSQEAEDLHGGAAGPVQVVLVINHPAPTPGTPGTPPPAAAPFGPVSSLPLELTRLSDILWAYGGPPPTSPLWMLQGPAAAAAAAGSGGDAARQGKAAAAAAARRGGPPPPSPLLHSVWLNFHPHGAAESAGGEKDREEEGGGSGSSSSKATTPTATATAPTLKSRAASVAGSVPASTPRTQALFVSPPTPAPSPAASESGVASTTKRTMMQNAQVQQQQQRPRQAAGPGKASVPAAAAAAAEPGGGVGSGGSVGSNVVLGGGWQLLQGPSKMWQRFGGADVCLAPGSFVQANYGAFQKVLAAIESQVPAGSRVTELHSGVGAIGLSLAASRKADISRLRCVEINPQASTRVVPPFRASLERLAEQRHRQRAPALDVQLITAAAGSDPWAFLADSDVVVVDPPRKGLEAPLLQALCSIASDPPAAPHTPPPHQPATPSLGDSAVIGDHPSSGASGGSGSGSRSLAQAVESLHLVGGRVTPVTAVSETNTGSGGGGGGSSGGGTRDGAPVSYPTRLIYLSCGFTAFQHDCDALLTAGWSLASSTAFLFFPGTDSLETLAVFERATPQP